jgi:hypothetical protein
MEKILTKIKYWMSWHSNSELFWNGLVYLAFIITLCISPQLAFEISGLGSFLVLMYFFVCMDDMEDTKTPLWMPLTIAFWVLWGLVYVGLGIWWVIKNTIIRFNKWLDSPNKNTK